MLRKFKKAKNITFRDYREELTLVLALFLISLFAGIMQSVTPPEFVGQVLDQLIAIIDEIGVSNSVDIFAFILINNLIAVFSVIIGGIIFGISPVLSSAVNGYIIGIVVGQMINSGDGWLVLPGILPHGILELPALFIAIALGLRLGRKFFACLKTMPGKSRGFADWYRKTINALRPLELEVLASLKYAWYVIVPLIAISALIEATATPALIDYVQNSL